MFVRLVITEFSTIKQSVVSRCRDSTRTEVRSVLPAQLNALSVPLSPFAQGAQLDTICSTTFATLAVLTDISLKMVQTHAKGAPTTVLPVE